MTLRLGIGTAVAAVFGAAAFWALADPPVAQPRGIQLTLVTGGLKVTSAPVSATTAGARTAYVKLTDARGTGAGWSLRLVSSRPVTVSSVTVSCARNSTCTLPQSSGLGHRPLVLQSRTGSGMGVIRMVVTLAPLASGPPVPVSFAVSG